MAEELRPDIGEKEELEDLFLVRVLPTFMGGRYQGRPPSLDLVVVGRRLGVRRKRNHAREG